MNLEILSGKKVLVIGDVMLDKKIIGEVSRISPEAPVPLLLEKEVLFELGGASNVAKNIIGLGNDAILVGVIGTDNYGKIVSDLAKKQKIDYIFFKDRSTTTVKTRYYSGNHYLFRTDKEVHDKISEDTEELIINSIKEKDFSIVIISDYNKGIVTEGLIKKLKEMKKIIIMDPKPSKVEQYNGVDYITPNVKELGQISAHYGLLDEVENTDNYLKKSLIFLGKKIDTKVIVTRSEKGISYLENNELITVPVISGEVYDVTGAGDSTIATIALALASNENLNNACVLGVAAGCSAVRYPGTITVNKEKIKKELMK